MTRRVAAEAIADAGIEGAELDGDRDHQPARDRRRLGPRERRADPPGAGLAGPPHRRRAATSCARPGTSRWSASAPGSTIDPYFSGTKIEWLLRNAEGAERAVFGTIDSWLALQAHRPPRHRLHERLADDAVRHPQARLGRGALRRCSGSTRRGCREPLPSAGVFGTTAEFGGEVPVAGIAGDQQAALFGQACHRAGDGEEHLRHRQLRPPQHRRRSRRRSRDGLLATVAWGLGEEVDLRARGLDLRHRRRGAVAARRARDHRRGGGDARRSPPRSSATTASTSSRR